MWLFVGLTYHELWVDVFESRPDVLVLVEASNGD